MALVTEFQEAPSANPVWRSETACGYRIADVVGQRVLHLETYGSADRPVPKGSQYLTFNEDAARTLMHLLLQAFPGLGEASS